jgi:hypothetical protein
LAQENGVHPMQLEGVAQVVVDLELVEVAEESLGCSDLLG